MKTLNTLSLAFVAGVCVFLPCRNIVKADSGKHELPGADLKLEEALVPKVDLIAVAKLVKIGRLYPPRMPGYREYDTTFEIIKALRGSGSGKVLMSMYVGGPWQNGTGGVQEGVKYILFCYIEDDGRRVIGKILPDDEKTEREVAAAIAAAH